MSTTSTPADQPEPSPTDRVRTPVVVLVVVVLIAVGIGLGAALRLGSDAQTIAVPAADSVAVGFAQDMSVHHDQAIQMASTAFAATASPEIRSLAFDVLTTQQAQVGQMQGWLSLWGRAALPDGSYMSWMRPAEQGMSVQGGGRAEMPGMASQGELATLRDLTGAELDTTFLQLLLRHHQGGAGMLSDAAARAEEPVVANFARQVGSAQRTESDHLAELLAVRGAKPLPSPR